MIDLVPIIRINTSYIECAIWDPRTGTSVVGVVAVDRTAQRGEFVFLNSIFIHSSVLFKRDDDGYDGEGREDEDEDEDEGDRYVLPLASRRVSSRRSV